MTATQSHDAYLAAQPADKRAVLQHLRETIRAHVPEAEEVISYAMPGFRLPGGKVFAGYAAKKNCGYYPHSGNILRQFADELAAWKTTPGAIQFTPVNPLLDDLVRRLVTARMKEIATGK
jgi:uncharacterized protein YdhG (YjbR/CyaY superfamily)